MDSFFRFHHRCSSALLYRLTVVYDRCGIKKQRIVCFRKVDLLSERGRRDIADIDKRYFGIARSNKRCYTAAERIPENDEAAFLRGIRICNPDNRARTAEEHFIRISACGSAEVINRNVRRRFNVIYLKPPYHGVIEIAEGFGCVREGCLTVINAVKRNACVMFFTLSYPLRAHFIRNFVGNFQYSFLAPVRIGIIEIIRRQKP